MVSKCNFVDWNKRTLTDSFLKLIYFTSRSCICVCPGSSIHANTVYTTTYLFDCFECFICKSLSFLLETIDWNETIRYRRHFELQEQFFCGKNLQKTVYASNQKRNYNLHVLVNSVRYWWTYLFPQCDITAVEAQCTQAWGSGQWQDRKMRAKQEISANTATASRWPLQLLQVGKIPSQRTCTMSNSCTCSCLYVWSWLRWKKTSSQHVELSLMSSVCVDRDSCEQGRS